MKVDINIGSGGKATHNFIKNQIVSKLKNGILERLDDSAVLETPKSSRLAMTTDSYVVNPLFFAGGDIGRLAVSGTVNDLTTSGAVPYALSLAFILEEGIPLSSIEKIVDSIAIAAKEANVKIVTGDTKVVEKGKGDQIYINTCGLGYIEEGVEISTYNAKKGDQVILTGPMGNHEITLMKEREVIDFELEVKSDVAPLSAPVQELLKLTKNINVIKDPTRGGVASALHEISSNSSVEITIDEELLPVDEQVATVCDILGLDPLYLANEGKFIIIAPKSSLTSIFTIFPSAVTIGEVTDSGTSKLLLETPSGGIRRVGMLETTQLPRIC